MTGTSGFRVSVCGASAGAEARPLLPGTTNSRHLPGLHDRLTAIHPCICDLPDEQVDDGAWVDGPLIDNFAHRAAVLGIASTRVGKVLPFLIETATAMGLMVFDWQDQSDPSPLIEAQPTLRCSFSPVWL